MAEKKKKCRGKGSSYERLICKRLSMWFSNGEEDDLFWRTGGSGGRAKTRSKNNLRTINQYGDVAPTCKVTEPLMRVLTIEIKRGYKGSNYYDMIDARPDMAIQPYDDFLNQAITDSENAKVPFWILITKRDQREAVVAMPSKLFRHLKEIGTKLYKAPHLKMYYRRPLFMAVTTKFFNPKTEKKGTQTKKNIVGYKSTTIYIMSLEDFLKRVRPKHIMSNYIL